MKQRGVVLILTLLFLFVLTLLVLSLFETGLLQNKMLNNLSNREIAFLHAESSLSAAQHKLSIQPVTGIVIGKGWQYICTTSNTQCESNAIGCYHIIATGESGYAKVVLQAVYQLEAIKNNTGEITIKISRRSWMENKI
jgi:Tfp pilus assembly protein PilX